MNKIDKVLGARGLKIFKNSFYVNHMKFPIVTTLCLFPIARTAIVYS